MLDSSRLSYQRLREITAELADKKFLRYIEPDEMYITTDKGDQIPGGNKRDRKKERLTEYMLSNEAKNEHLLDKFPRHL